MQAYNRNTCNRILHGRVASYLQWSAHWKIGCWWSENGWPLWASVFSLCTSITSTLPLHVHFHCSYSSILYMYKLILICHDFKKLITDQRTLFRAKSCLKCQKCSPYKVKGVFSTHVCARKQTNSLPDVDQGFSTGSYSCRHALSARGVHLPTSPCPTPSASTEPIFKMGCANW